MESIDDAEQGGDQEGIGEKTTERIDAHGRKRQSKKLHLAETAIRQHQQVKESERRQEQHKDRAPTSRQHRDRQRSEYQDQPRIGLTDHSNSQDASGRGEVALRQALT